MSIQRDFRTYNTYRSWDFYSGTAQNPDDVIIIAKKGDNFVLQNNSCMVNFFNKAPVLGYFGAIARITKATSKIFSGLNKLSLTNSEKWNAVKNLFRGFLELIPVVGFVSLFIFDMQRTLRLGKECLENIKDADNIIYIYFNKDEVIKLDLDKFKEEVENKLKAKNPKSTANLDLNAIMYLLNSTVTKCSESNDDKTLKDRVSQQMLNLLDV